MNAKMSIDSFVPLSLFSLCFYTQLHNPSQLPLFPPCIYSCWKHTFSQDVLLPCELVFSQRMTTLKLFSEDKYSSSSTCWRGWGGKVGRGSTFEKAYPVTMCLCREAYVQIWDTGGPVSQWLLQNQTMMAGGRGKRTHKELGRIS